MVFLEHPLHRLQEVFRRHVHDSQVFVIEAAMGFGALAVPRHQMLEHAQMRADMAVEVHPHEARELHEARIDPPPEPRIGRRHGLDQHLLEPPPAVRPGEFVDLRDPDTSVDRPAHQHERTRRGLACRGEQRRCRQRRHGRLADGDEMHLRPEPREKIQQGVDIVVERERAAARRHLPGVLPVGDIDVMLCEQAAHRVAKQGGEMAGKRRHHQHDRVPGSPFALEMQEVAERRGSDNTFPHGQRPAAAQDLADAEFRLAVLAADALEQLAECADRAPGGMPGHRQERIGRRLPAGLGHHAGGRPGYALHLVKRVKHIGHSR